MATNVRLIAQRRVPLDDIVEALEGAGARDVRVDPRTGDSYEGVSRYFYIEFDDPHGSAARRVAFGFHCPDSDEHPNGWTRLQIGADARGRDLIAAVGEAVGGSLYDNRTGEETDFDGAPALALCA